MDSIKNIDSIKERISRMIVPIHLDEPNRAMDKKLVITVAPSGVFIKKQQNPNHPYTAQEIVPHVIESYKEGASVWHMHLRDENAVPEGRQEIFTGAIDKVLDKCPDMILSHSGHVDPSKEGANSLRPRCDPLLEASTKYGRKYIETVVIVPAMTGHQPMNEPILKDMIDYLQGNGVKPEFQIFNYTCIHHVNRWLIAPEILKKPYIMNVISGFHGDDYVGPTLPDPYGYTYLTSMVQTLPQGSVIGATIGGHNWLPLTIFAVMLGVDCVRIGMEDTIWMYPHRDEKIKKCADVVRKVANIARELGRDIATPQETRTIWGLDS